MASLSFSVSQDHLNQDQRVSGPSLEVKFTLKYGTCEPQAVLKLNRKDPYPYKRE